MPADPASVAAACQAVQRGIDDLKRRLGWETDAEDSTEPASVDALDTAAARSGTVHKEALAALSWLIAAVRSDGRSPDEDAVSAEAELRGLKEDIGELHRDAREFERGRRGMAKAQKSVLGQLRMQRRRDMTLPTAEAVAMLMASRPAAADGNDLAAYALQILSQHGEDGMVHEILRRAGMPLRTSIEIGCGSNGGNSGLLAAAFGYRSLMIDGNEQLAQIASSLFAERDVTVRQAWVTRESVNDLVRDAGFSGPVDYFGLDLDGIDYWIWDGLQAVDPLLAVVEYNPYMGAEVAAAVAYRPDFNRKTVNRVEGAPRGYWGASLGAFAALGRRRGYRLVATSPTGSNAFFLKEGVCPELPGLGVSEAWRGDFKGREALYQQINQGDPLRYFADAGWPLTVVD